MFDAISLVRMCIAKRAPPLLTSADVEDPELVLCIDWLLLLYWQYTLHRLETYHAQAEYMQSVGMIYRGEVLAIGLVCIGSSR
jgi:hypothetical protein